MAMVCKEWFPKGSYPYQKEDGFYMHDALKQQLDYLIKNVGYDWDFVILICGEGEVRVGKSIISNQIGAYWTYQVERRYGVKLKFSIDENIVFDGRRLIKKGNDLGAKNLYHWLSFDEAGADLEGAKVMRTQTQQVKDYLRECGQYNMLTNLVLPEFFDLPKGIALSRSIFLINVYYYANEEGYFKRGRFKFYSRPSKKHLYLTGKKNLDYKVTNPDFHGDFINFNPLDDKKYRKKKVEALKKREYTSTDKRLMQRNFCFYLIVEELGFSQRELAKRLTDFGIYTDHTTIGDAIRGIKGEDAEKNK